MKSCLKLIWLILSIKSGKSTGLEVLQVFPEEGNMGRVLPKYLSQWTTRKVEGEGVKILPNSQVQSATLDGEQLVLSLQDGQEVLKSLNLV